jgi:hypothetical protein
MSINKNKIKEYICDKLQANDNIKSAIEYKSLFKEIFYNLMKYYENFDQSVITNINNYIKNPLDLSNGVTQVYGGRSLNGKVYMIKTENSSYIIKSFSHEDEEKKYKEMVIASYVSCVRDPVFIYFPDVYYLGKTLDYDNNEICYMVSENINSLGNASLLSKFIVDKIFAKNFKLNIKKIFFEIFHALKLVNISLNGFFMHYDLHPENIFVIENNQKLILDINNVKYNVSGIRIAIFDFGSAIAVSNCYDDCYKYDFSKQKKKLRNNARQYATMMINVNRKMKIRENVNLPFKYKLKIISSDLRFLYFVLKNLCLKKLITNDDTCEEFDKVNDQKPYDTYLTHKFFKDLII